MGSSEPVAAPVQKVVITPQGYHLLDEARNNQKLIRKAERQVERERKKLELTEKKTLMEIKKLAKLGKANAAKILTNDLIRERKQIESYYLMQSQIKSIGLQISSVAANVVIKNALSTAASTLGKVNLSLDMNDIKAVLKQYAKESAKMEMKNDMFTDAIDMTSEPVGNEVDDVYNQVCQEIGIEINQQLNHAPNYQLGVGQKNNPQMVIFTRELMT